MIDAQVRQRRRDGKMFVLSSELLGDKAVVTVQGSVSSTVRDLRSLALSAVPSNVTVSLNTENMVGYKGVTTFTWSV